MTSELVYSMFKYAFVFSLVSKRRGNVLAPDSPFKQRDTWKGKIEAMELKCTNLHKELLALQEEVNATNSLQEVVKVHDSSSTPEARVAKFEGSL